MLLSAMIGGLVDVDAVLLSVSEFVDRAEAAPTDAVVAIVLAAASNAGFKALLAISSGRPAFHVRVTAGLAITIAAALAIALGWR